MEDYLETIQTLLANPPCFEDLVTTLTDRFVEYDVKGGFAVGHGVLHDEDAAVQKLFISGGTTFPEHDHNQFEYLITLDGEGEYTIDGKTKQFNGFDCIVVKPGQRHSWFYRTATKQIVITIPPSKGFPHDA